MQTYRKPISQIRREAKYRWMAQNSHALLGAGTVDLTTGESKYFNVIDNCYGHPGALFLVRHHHNGSFMVVSGAGNPEGYSRFQPGMNPITHHDQTGAMRPPMTVIASGTTSLETMKGFIQKINDLGINRKKVSFSVFK